MPYEWDVPIHEAPVHDADGRDAGGDPIAVLHLWPYRSLPKRGFAFAIGFAYLMMMIPIAGFVGTMRPILMLPNVGRSSGMHGAAADRAGSDDEKLDNNPKANIDANDDAQILPDRANSG